MRQNELRGPFPTQNVQAQASKPVEHEVLIRSILRAICCLIFLRIWIFSGIAERSLETSSAAWIPFRSQDQQKRLRPAEAYEMTHMSSIARRYHSDLKDPNTNAFVHYHISSRRSLCYTYQGIGGSHCCNRHFEGSAVWIFKHRFGSTRLLISRSRFHKIELAA